jgi:hypothetical protein
MWVEMPDFGLQVSINFVGKEGGGGMLKFKPQVNSILHGNRASNFGGIEGSTFHVGGMPKFRVRHSSHVVEGGMTIGEIGEGSHAHTIVHCHQFPTPMGVPSHMVDGFLVNGDEDECMWSFETAPRIYVDQGFNNTMLDV